MISWSIVHAPRKEPNLSSKIFLNPLNVYHFVDGTIIVEISSGLWFGNKSFQRFYGDTRHENSILLWYRKPSKYKSPLMAPGKYKSAEER